MSFFCRVFCYFGIIVVVSFVCHFLIQRGWLDPEPSWKVQKRNFTSTRVICLSFFVIFLSFSRPDQASGEGGKPGLGNAKKMQKNDSRFGKCKKMPKNDSQSGKCKKNAKKITRVLVKLRFWSFQVDPASRP